MQSGIRSHATPVPPIRQIFLLHEFLEANCDALIEQCRLKAARRSPKTMDGPLAYGVPLFLDQVIKTLQVELTSEPMRSRKVSGPAGGGLSGASEIGAAARLHAHELLQHG